MKTSFEPIALFERPGFQKRASDIFRGREAVVPVAELAGDANLVILDHVGAKYLKPNMSSLGYTGKLVIIGIISGIKAELNLALMMVKRQQIIGSVLRSRPVAEKGDIIAEFTRTALPKFADRSIVPIIEKVFSIDQIVEAHTYVDTGTKVGNVVVTT